MRVNPDSPESRVVSKNRLRAAVFFVLAIIAGFAGLVLFMRYMDRIKDASAREVQEQVQVVLAAVDLPIATALEEKHLATVMWPKAHVPEGSFSKKDDLIGHTLRQAMVKGEVVLKTRIADEKQGAGMAALLNPGQRAMAVKVDSVVGIAGFVKPGDFVDVITVMSPDDETEETLRIEAAKVSKIILQNIKVLAVGEHLETGGQKPVTVKVVTLAVGPEETEKLALASLHGKIQLTMRSPIDLESAATVGVTPLMLLTPDEGAVAPELRIAKAEVPAVPEPVKEKEPVRRAKKRKKHTATAEETPEDEVKPATPVVEILRGNKVEERKLRVYEE